METEGDQNLGCIFDRMMIRDATKWNVNLTYLTEEYEYLIRIKNKVKERLK